tara:strand:+ start:3665 stop:3991 length:327 start_codon:yes stop_codon:yes gene_type:complete
MAYYAKIVDAKVINVITAEESFFDTFYDDAAGLWLETKMDGSIRKNYAGIGFSYDAIKDAFIPPQPFPSWTLNEDTFIWECPVAYPNDNNMYEWNEDSQEWELIDNSV